MSLWARLFAAWYEPALRSSERHGLAALRAELVGGAHGRTLELGAGTGLNLAHYPGRVTELVLSEPDEHMAAKLEARARGASARVVRAGAERLPFPDARFDTVVATLVFCSVEHLGRALAEVRRVLVPGGQLLFLEHVRHPDAARARRQRRLTPLQRRVACGCHLDRATPAAIAQAGFAVSPERFEHFPKAPAFLQPLAFGRATR